MTDRTEYYKKYYKKNGPKMREYHKERYHNNPGVREDRKFRARLRYLEVKLNGILNTYGDI